ncbi:GNAT family N-acetyltransferase [Mongoliibacter ruber]|uniref:Acetyltransferase (GNAT) family protein n=1 Tax=Mongoliibacter ruber TaxID=1750599 RepID=A0A2T0WGM7_9BACT|nr:GNAT family N-acetyltransferase [Mongoliibacter ruber]PRY85674.1 acetyltransferase (GNAT) family protein [Mongoliibacter ruber]
MKYSCDPSLLFDSQYSEDLDHEYLLNIHEQLDLNSNQGFYVDSSNCYLKASFLNWDSNHFGFPMARLEYLFFTDSNVIENNWKLFIDWLTENRINHVSFRSNSQNIEVINYLKSNNFSIISRKYMLRIAKDRYVNKQTILPLFELPLNNEILYLGEKSFKYGRFFNDQFIDNSKAKLLYKKWLENSIIDKNHSIILNVKEDEVLGFVLFKKGLNYSSDLDLQFPHGLISLIATNENHAGKGIGKQLLNSAMWHLFERESCKVVYANTDIMNLESLRLFQSQGFTVYNELSELRMWYSSDSSK